jgi:hypothetical protein
MVKFRLSRIESENVAFATFSLSAKPQLLPRFLILDCLKIDVDLDGVDGKTISDASWGELVRQPWW